VVQCSGNDGEGGGGSVCVVLLLYLPILLVRLLHASSGHLKVMRLVAVMVVVGLP